MPRTGHHASFYSGFRKDSGVCLEMGAYAVPASAIEGTLPEAKPMIIKGVYDFADDSKSDDFQAYSSYAAAMIMKRLVEKV
jgi:hypothetical protein